ncbi:hypothetical protein M404DRAFT_1005423 [Pisolithus tinctorius Marx 270]|uniref:Integrase zinc-binding domain-containing protein n=1 Tax=Pisolithus tinctorius Marx 270 TaxID=870435 RepID=A0A0C3JL35_PISTI|nr:hypothetical protein M404DRAFT_1005423 [Pisolithus tinctorius Marx 270]
MSHPRKRNDCWPSTREPFRELPNGYYKRPPSPSPSPYNEPVLQSHASASSLSDDNSDCTASSLAPAGPITTSQPGFPTYEEYKRIEAAYLANLAPRKRTKALITQATFDQIWEVLWHPGSTRVGTPQFRFWVRKTFRLVTVQGEGGRVGQAWRPSSNSENGSNLKGKRGKDKDLPPVVLHDNRPVAIMEQMYEVLCYCHGLTEHGGRDKTCAAIRRHYSWVPKELVAQFVRGCPTCLVKRAGNLALAVTTDGTNDWVSKEKQGEETGAGNSDKGVFSPIARSPAGPAGSSTSSILKASIPRPPNDENVLPTVPRPLGGSTSNMRRNNPFPSASQPKTAVSTQNNARMLANNYLVPCRLNTVPQLPPYFARPDNTLRYHGNLISGNDIWDSAGLPPLREALLGSAIRNRPCTLCESSTHDDVNEPILQHLLFTRPVHQQEPVVPERYIDPVMLSLSRMEELPTSEITPPLRTSTPVSRDISHRHTSINPSIGPVVFSSWIWATDINEM